MKMNILLSSSPNKMHINWNIVSTTLQSSIRQFFSYIPHLTGETYYDISILICILNLLLKWICLKVQQITPSKATVNYSSLLLWLYVQGLCLPWMFYSRKENLIRFMCINDFLTFSNTNMVSKNWSYFLS